MAAVLRSLGRTTPGVSRHSKPVAVAVDRSWPGLEAVAQDERQAPEPAVVADRSWLRVEAVGQDGTQAGEPAVAADRSWLRVEAVAQDEAGGMGSPEPLRRNRRKRAHPRLRVPRTLRKTEPLHHLPIRAWTCPLRRGESRMIDLGPGSVNVSS